MGPTFSCWVSWAYVSSSWVFSLAEPTQTSPRAMPAASPATALSVYRMFLTSSNTSSSLLPREASPRPRQAPCCATCKHQPILVTGPAELSSYPDAHPRAISECTAQCDMTQYRDDLNEQHSHCLSTINEMCRTQSPKGPLKRKYAPTPGV